MRVLMFGWEFPPHIAGGLGTACYGMTKGLAYNDVDVLFVMPSASGDEDESAVKIINASDVAVDTVSATVDEFLGKVQFVHIGTNMIPYVDPQDFTTMVEEERKRQIKGFPVSSRFADLKAYEPVAQVTAGAASTTGWWEGPDNVPTQSGAALGDSNTGMHCTIGILAALMKRQHTGEGSFVYQSMHNACLNLCRIKTRDQLTLDRIGYLTQFPQYPNEKFADYVPRSGNQEGSGVLGWTYKCKGWETDPNAYAYVILQRGAKDFEKACQAMGFQDWLTNPDFNTADARDRHKQEIYARVQQFCIDKDKFEVVKALAPYGVPAAPVLSTKEIMNDQSLYDGNTLVKIDQGGKIGEFVTVGVPFTISDFQPTYGPCPALGGNTDEVLTALGYTTDQIASFKANGTTAPVQK